MFTLNGDVRRSRDGLRARSFSRNPASVAASVSGIGVEQRQGPVPQVIESVTDAGTLDGQIILEPQCLQMVQRPDAIKNVITQFRTSLFNSYSYNSYSHKDCLLHLSMYPIKQIIFRFD